MKRIPIVIPFKLHSIRCPDKNIKLLPYTIKYLEKVGRLNDTILITQSNTIVSYGAKIFVEKRQESWCEFESIQNYIKDTDITEFIWLPVTQPCRDKTLIDRTLEHDLSKCDLVTSFVKEQNRSLFEIKNNKFIIQDSERKGSLCTEREVADGAIYYMSATFLNKVVQSENPNKTFWNSYIGFVRNYAPLIDIDTKEDLASFLTFMEVFK